MIYSKASFIFIRCHAFNRSIMYICTYCRLKQIANPDCASHPAFVYRSPESWSLVTTLMNHAANEGLWDTIRRAFTTVLHLVSSVKPNQIKLF
jgi:hypothetical protein